MDIGRGGEKGRKRMEKGGKKGASEVEREAKGNGSRNLQMREYGKIWGGEAGRSCYPAFLLPNVLVSRIKTGFERAAVTWRTRARWLVPGRRNMGEMEVEGERVDGQLSARFSVSLILFPKSHLLPDTKLPRPKQLLYLFSALLCHLFSWFKGAKKGRMGGETRVRGRRLIRYFGSLRRAKPEHGVSPKTEEGKNPNEMKERWAEIEGKRKAVKRQSEASILSNLVRGLYIQHGVARHPTSRSVRACRPSKTGLGYTHSRGERLWWERRVGGKRQRYKPPGYAKLHVCTCVRICICVCVHVRIDGWLLA